MTAVGEEDNGAVFHAHDTRHARVYAAQIHNAYVATRWALHADAALVSVSETLRASMRLAHVVLFVRTTKKAAAVVDGQSFVEAQEARSCLRVRTLELAVPHLSARPAHVPLGRVGVRKAAVPYATTR